MLACALCFGSRSRAKEELEHTSTSPTAKTAATTAAAGTTTERHIGVCVVVIEGCVCRRRRRRVKGALGFDLLGRTGLGARTPKTLIPIFFWLESGQGFLPLGTRGWWGIGGSWEPLWVLHSVATVMLGFYTVQESRASVRLGFHHSVHHSFPILEPQVKVLFLFLTFLIAPSCPHSRTRAAIALDQDR